MNMFELDDCKLNPDGLYEYAMNIGEKLGVKYIVAVHTNGDEYESSEYIPDKRIIILPARFFQENLPMRDYKALKGAIDHEAAHVIWPDTSYFFQENLDNDNRELIWDIGNIIDDIRIEHRMVKEYQVDENNFRYLLEKLLPGIYDIHIEYVTDKVTDLLFTLVNIHYRKMNLISMNDIKSSKIATVFFNKIIPIIDHFIDSDEKAGIVAREIIDIFNAIIME